MCSSADPVYELLYEPVSKSNENLVLGGYKKDLLIRELTELEEKMLICRVCGGVMREDCFTQHEDVKKEGAYADTGIVGETIAGLRIQCPLYNQGCCWVDVIPEVHKHLDNCAYRAKSCIYSEYGCTALIQQGKIESHLRDSCNEHMLQLLQQVRKCTLLLDKSNLEIESLAARNFELEATLKQRTKYLQAQVDAVEMSNKIRAGGITWVFRDIVQQIQDKAKIWGPHFYVDGYKFQVMLVFGHEDSASLALFLCLVRGERDQDLQWPFKLDKEKFVFSLQKRSGAEVTLLTITTSEANLENFRRPESSRNKARGTTELVPLSCLSDYCSEDSITVKTCVQCRTDVTEELSREVQTLLRSQDIRGMGIVWKVEGISRMIADKVEEWGPSFYVGRYLFHPTVRFCCNSLPNMGLYVALFKSPYDNELSWPFRMGSDKFTFILLDRHGNEAVTNSAVITEKNIHLFTRPEGVRNPAYGCASMISHEMLLDGDFMVEDCLCIKIKIQSKRTHSHST